MAKELTKMSEREIFDRMNALAHKYDPFIQYIDDYKQFKTAEIKNKEASEEWDTICTYIGVENASIRTYAEDIDCIKENLGYLFAESKMFSKNKEDKDMMNMTVKELKAVAKEVGVKGYSKMNKADLVAAIQFFTNEERKESEAVVAPVIEEPVVEEPVVETVVEEPVVEEPVVETVVEEKENKEVSMKEKYMDAKWDKLVKAVAAEYVKQSLGVKWALFYKNTKATATKAEYLVKTKKLWGATSKVIKNLYGEKNCNEDTIQQTLNAMVVRGYLNFQKVQGKNGTNVIFNASADQMNAMWKLSK